MNKVLLIESSAPLVVPGVQRDRVFSESIKQLTESSSGLLRIQLPVTILNKVNGNNRMYTDSMMKKAIEDCKSYMDSGMLLGVGDDHPEEPYVKPIDASHIVRDAWVENQDGVSYLMNVWEILNTANGKNLRAVFEAGGAFGVSIRGLGVGTESSEGYEVIEDYEYLGTDAVGNPSARTYAGIQVPRVKIVGVAESKGQKSESVTMSGMGFDYGTSTVVDLDEEDDDDDDDDIMTGGFVDLDNDEIKYDVDIDDDDDDDDDDEYNFEVILDQSPLDIDEPSPLDIDEVRRRRRRNEQFNADGSVVIRLAGTDLELRRIHSDLKDSGIQFKVTGNDGRSITISNGNSIRDVQDIISKYSKGKDFPAMWVETSSTIKNLARLMPTDLETLSTDDKDGWTVAHQMAENGHEFIDPKVLMLVDENGWTVAHEMAKRGYSFSDINILKRSTLEDWSVAHEMAMQGHKFDKWEVLKIADNTRWTVAHEMASRNHVFTDPNVLKLTTKKGWSVADEMKVQGNLAEKQSAEALNSYSEQTLSRKQLQDLARSKPTDVKTLSIADEDGWTVAHEMVDDGYKFTDFEVLKLADENGWTVAHQMAYKGAKITDLRVLKLATDWNWSVAHEMATHGHKFTNMSVLEIANSQGWTVAHEMAFKTHKFTDPEILQISTNSGVRVSDVMISPYRYEPLRESIKSMSLGTHEDMKSYTEQEMDRRQIQDLARSKPTDLATLKIADRDGWTVAHAMAQLGASFTDNDILSMANDQGWSVAHEMAYQGKLLSSFKILSLRNHRGWTVAHEMAQNKHSFTDVKVLSMADVDGWTVAHEMAKWSYKLKDKRVLMLKDKNGWSVAHQMAARGHIDFDQDVLDVVDSRGWSVADEVARTVKRLADSKSSKNANATLKEFGEDIKNYNEQELSRKQLQDLARSKPTDIETLSTADGNGWTVAHEMARRGHKFKDPNILKLSNDNNWTVAHQMASQGHKFTDFKILKLADGNGQTVAHKMAADGHIFSDLNVLKLADKNGWSVAHASTKEIASKKDFNTLKIADKNGWTVAHEMVRRGIKFSDLDILKLSNNKGWTVAHQMAAGGHVFTDNDILNLSTNSGHTVAQVMAEQGNMVEGQTTSHENTPVNKHLESRKYQHGKEDMKSYTEQVLNKQELRDIAKTKPTDFETLSLADKKGFTVAHQMATFDRAVFTDVKVLQLADMYGWTVAHMMARRGHNFTDPKILTLRTTNGQWTVAHEMAVTGHVFKDLKILKLVDKKGWSVAHVSIKKISFKKNKDILKIATREDWTVAHEMAAVDNITFVDPEILALTDDQGRTVAEFVDLNSRQVDSLAKRKPSDKIVLSLSDKEGWTVAHQMASQGARFTDPDLLGLSTKTGWSVADEMEKQVPVSEGLTRADLKNYNEQELSRNQLKDLAKSKPTDFATLSMSDKSGWSVAHYMALYDRAEFKDPDVLRLVDKTGWTVAHEMASHGYEISDFKILMLKNNLSWSVAHEMARKGHVFRDVKVLQIADRNGWSVAHASSKKASFKKKPDILRLADKSGWTVAHEMASTNNITFTDPEVLSFTDKDGRTVAEYVTLNLKQVLAVAKGKPSNKDVLSLSSKEGWSVAHQMAKEGEVFSDYDILTLRTSDLDKHTVAEIMVQEGYRTTDRKILSIITGYADSVLADIMASHGHIFTEFDILSMKANLETTDTVAHVTARRGYLFTDKKILAIANKDGWTVAHTSANRGHKFTDPEILAWSNSKGWSVADEMAEAQSLGTKPGFGKSTPDAPTRMKIIQIAREMPTDPAILMMADDKDFTVAHQMATKGYVFKDPEILMLQDENGDSVAKLTIRAGSKPNYTDMRILSLRDGRGTTVAYQMASRQHKFTDPEILALANEDGIGLTVAHRMAELGDKFTDPKILNLKNDSGETVQDFMTRTSELWGESQQRLTEQSSDLQVGNLVRTTSGIEGVVGSITPDGLTIELDVGGEMMVVSQDDIDTVIRESVASLKLVDYIYGTTYAIEQKRDTVEVLSEDRKYSYGKFGSLEEACIRLCLRPTTATNGIPLKSVVESYLDSGAKVEAVRTIMSVESRVTSSDLNKGQVTKCLKTLSDMKSEIFGAVDSVTRDRKRRNTTERAVDLTNEIASGLMETQSLVRTIKESVDLPDKLSSKLDSLVSRVSGYDKLVVTTARMLDEQTEDVKGVVDLLREHTKSAVSVDTLVEGVNKLIESYTTQVVALESNVRALQSKSTVQMKLLEDVRKTTRRELHKLREGINSRDRLLSELRSKLKLTKSSKQTFSGVRADNEIAEAVQVILARNPQLKAFEEELMQSPTVEHVIARAKKYVKLPQAEKSRKVDLSLDSDHRGSNESLLYRGQK